MQVNLYLPKTT